MKIQTLALAGAVMLSSGAAQAANEWNWFAGADDGYKAEPAVSLLFGSMDPSGNMDSGNISGIELSLNCPLLQPPSNRIRQQISYAQYDEKGVKISSLELNPHYVIEVSPGLEIGAGPGLGYVMVDTPSGDGNVFALQLGISVHFTGMGPLFFGAEARRQVTGEDSFGAATESDVDNSRFAVKVGYSF